MKTKRQQGSGRIRPGRLRGMRLPWPLRVGAPHSTPKGRRGYDRRAAKRELKQIVAETVGRDFWTEGKSVLLSEEESDVVDAGAG